MSRQKALGSAPVTPPQPSGAAARRERARQVHLEELEECPGHLALGLVSERWATLVVEALVEGPRRHGELRRQVPGATQKMLTQTLRSLQRNGLVSRTVKPATPVGVEYRLTGLGEEFWRLQRVIHAWGVAHAAAVRAARTAFDARAADSPEPSVAELNRRTPSASFRLGRPTGAVRR